MTASSFRCFLALATAATSCTPGGKPANAPCLRDADCGDAWICVDSRCAAGFRACGDGVVDDGEVCDDGNDETEDACAYGTGSCTACSADCGSVLTLAGPTCGDGIKQFPERCDDGNRLTETACPYGESCLQCSADCGREIRFVGPRCGDGRVDEEHGEVCDDGDTVTETQCPYGFATCERCDATCSTPAALTGNYCGDGEVTEDEECDAGAGNSDVIPGACRTMCQNPRCGDGVVDDAEVCDAGPALSNTQPDACRTNCVPAHCGDRVVDSSESCDDGSANSDDEAPTSHCDASCSGDIPGYFGAMDGRLDPSRVYFLGTFTPGVCGGTAIAYWADGDIGLAGFGCTVGRPRIRPSDGQVFYRAYDGGPSVFRQFVCDSCPIVDVQQYPTSPEANDPVVNLPGCTTPPKDIIWSPDGDRYHTCIDTSGAWMDESGNVVYVAGFEGAKAFAATGGLLLADGLDVSVVIDTVAGTESELVGLDARSSDIYAARSHPDGGFWAAVLAWDDAELWHIDNTGLATLVGMYPPTPPGYMHLHQTAVLDGSGVLFHRSYNPATFTSFVVFRRELGGSSEIVYDEASGPAILIAAGELFSGP